MDGWNSSCNGSAMVCPVCEIQCVCIYYAPHSLFVSSLLRVSGLLFLEEGPQSRRGASWWPAAVAVIAFNNIATARLCD